MPSALDAERAVLGAILLRQAALAQAHGHIGPEDFFAPAHAAIFSAMLELDGQGRPIDPVTVSTVLERTGDLRKIQGGGDYLVALLDDVPTSENVEAYAQVIADKSILRKVALLASEVRAKALGQDLSADELLNFAQSQLLALASRSTHLEGASLVEVMFEAIEQLGKIREGKVSGFPTGFVGLDRLLGGGLQQTNLILLAARPSQGKTTLAINIALHAGQRIPVAVFSIEMGNRELAYRMISEEASVESQDLRSGVIHNPVKWREVLVAAPRIAARTKMTLFDRMSSPTIAEVRSAATRWAVKHTRNGEGLIILDYVQLMRGVNPRDSRENQVGEVSRGLKALAKELKMPVLVLSQLNRDCEKREDKRPVMADLRDSGSLEQDADVILFIYRDEVYRQDSPDKGKAEIICRKHRNGPTRTVPLGFDGRYTRFFNLSDRDLPPHFLDEERR